MENKKTMTMGEKSSKLSYEQLENAAKNMSVQINELNYKLRQAELTISAVNRLDYLIKILEIKNVFKEKFINDCATEVEKLMTLPEEDSKEEKK